MALHRNAAAGDRHPPYNWEFTDTADREAETIATADVYKTGIQVDDKSVWTAIATGSGSSKWARAGGDPNYVFSGATDVRTYTLPDADATIHTDKTKADVLQAALFATDTGAADAYVIDLTPAITAYVSGVEYSGKLVNANTGAATVNFNSLGAKSIKKMVDGVATALAANDIRANQWCTFRYDGTDMILVSPLGNAPAAGSGGSGDPLAAQVFS